METSSRTKRFFSDESYWNQPIPSDAETDPDSEKYVELLATGEGTSPFYVNMNSYTIPVYEVDENTPFREVNQKLQIDPTHDPKFPFERSSRYMLHPNFPKAIRVPEDALPDPGYDHHLCIVDRENQRAWDMWTAHHRRDGAIEAYTGIEVDLSGTGIWTPEDFPIKNGESIHNHGPSRAAGTPLVAGLIMHHEIMAGRIEHKIVFACWQNAACKHVFPACWTDGFLEWGLPEGATLQLDPTLDLDQFDLSPAARTVAIALQEYGMVDTDNARGTCICAEGLYGHDDKSWNGILHPDDLAVIPLEALRVIKIENMVEKGDRYWYSRKFSK
jgi:hypothetical protein